ncbi:major facilitator superfamily transporter multidrug resistance [Dactylonectria estremocensis]|uniref:Major facilitator superfamily transporter multidrug resistance n=1 Tax=Dactylonectria estremocensis TaxID=1079267 RepID=A0A9P9DNT1_9HYPO|nr:major facilitator superfamily transporter multidrug resistance [Dactylonectria estremocensis]
MPELSRKSSATVCATQPQPTPPSAEPIVPNITSEKRPNGLLARISLLPEIENAYAYERRVKWLITAVVAMAAATTPMSASIFYPSIQDMSRDLHASPTVINLSVAFYLLSSSIFPLWWSSYSETAGRRAIFLISFLLNAVLTFACGMSSSIAMLIALRLISGGAAASAQSVGAGVIADIWLPEERAYAMSIFYLGPLAGPLFLPLIGGVLTERFGWRSVIWFLTAYGVLILVLIALALPETLAKRHMGAEQRLENHSNDPLAIPSRKSRTRRGAKLIRHHLVNPLAVVAHLRFPPVAIVIYIAAIGFGSCYVLNISMQVAFSDSPYEYSPMIVGLLFIPNTVGCILVSVFGGAWVDKIMVRAAQDAGRYDSEGRPIYLPEDRVGLNAWVALTVYPVSLIWYGWTVQNGVHWAAPSVAVLFFGGGVMMVFSATTTMAAEFIPRNSSSGVALNNLIRNICSCAGTVIAQPLIDVMGHGWLLTIIGLLAWVTGYMCILFLKRRGQRWRDKMETALSVQCP